MPELVALLGRIVRKSRANEWHGMRQAVEENNLFEAKIIVPDGEALGIWDGQTVLSEDFRVELKPLEEGLAASVSLLTSIPKGRPLTV